MFFVLSWCTLIDINWRRRSRGKAMAHFGVAVDMKLQPLTLAPKDFFSIKNGQFFSMAI